MDCNFVLFFLTKVYFLFILFFTLHFFSIFNRPKVKKDKNRDGDKDKKPSWNTGGTKSRIDTNIVKLKLLDATRKAIIDKDRQKKTFLSTSMQTDTIKTKLCKDKLVDNQNDLINPTDVCTETDVDLIALKTKDGQGLS